MGICEEEFDKQQYVITLFDTFSGSTFSIKDVWETAWGIATRVERKECASVSPNGLSISANESPHVVWEKYSNAILERNINDLTPTPPEADS